MKVPQNLRILHLVPSLAGGAGRAAWRIHQSLQSVDSNFLPGIVSSSIRSIVSPFNDPDVHSGYVSRRQQLSAQLRERVVALRAHRFRGVPGIYHSFGAPGIGVQREINRSAVDLVHLHWCGGNLLSIEELGKLTKPLLWTLHDQWAFCGAEHYASLTPTGGFRYRDGYLVGNRVAMERGPDLNRSTWLRKRSAWRYPFHIVAPSRWLARCVQESVLMRDWPVRVIPHPIDLSIWQPLDQRFARQALHLPENKLILLFGVDSGCAKPNKGADLLLTALNLLLNDPDLAPRLHLAVFGQQLSPQQHLDGLSTQFIGRFHDDVSLRLAYAAADLLVMPSRVEAFGLTAAEAHACGTPVACFDTSGLRDIVEHQRTGWRAEPFSAQSLALGISWMLADVHRCRDLGYAARLKAQQVWSPPQIKVEYMSLYQQILAKPVQPVTSRSLL